jgi:hypothetical protein
VIFKWLLLKVSWHSYKYKVETSFIFLLTCTFHQKKNSSPIKFYEGGRELWERQELWITKLSKFFKEEKFLLQNQTSINVEDIENLTKTGAIFLFYFTLKSCLFDHFFSYTLLMWIFAIIKNHISWNEKRITLVPSLSYLLNQLLIIYLSGEKKLQTTFGGRIFRTPEMFAPWS